jgi:hypothetical protein
MLFWFKKMTCTDKILNCPTFEGKFMSYFPLMRYSASIPTKFPAQCQRFFLQIHYVNIRTRIDQSDMPDTAAMCINTSAQDQHHSPCFTSLACQRIKPSFGGFGYKSEVKVVINETFHENFKVST